MNKLLLTSVLEKPIVVFGAGSIGERHIGVLQKIGFKKIYVYRTRKLPLRVIDENSVTVFTDLNQIEDISPFAAVICTPTSLHLEQALFCASKGIHILVEKPLSHSIANIEALAQEVEKTQVVVQIAYMLRYHPAMKMIKEIVLTEKYGRVLSFHTHWGEFLPDWHPWEDYRASYAARKELGGGAALTLSHDLDIVNWWLDETPDSFFKLLNTRSALEVNVESGADFLLGYPSGVTGHVHLNFFQKVPRRSYQLVMENGLVEYDYFENRLLVQSAGEKEEVFFSSFDRNDMFIDQALHFFESITTFTDQQKVDYSLSQIKSAATIVDMTDFSK